jgi:hypothetical protein
VKQETLMEGVSGDESFDGFWEEEWQEEKVVQAVST